MYNTKNNRNMKLKYGVGTLDVKGASKTKAYKVWDCMLKRCYSKNDKNHKSSYKDCVVCDEWLLYSNFEKWYNNNYIEGYSIDKDLLSPGNRIYSPQTCCFLPPEINTRLISHSIRKTEQPIGVTVDTKQGGYQVIVKQHGKSRRIGNRYDDIDSAFKAYCSAKKEYIKEIAEDFYKKGKIERKIYDALLNYNFPCSLSS